MPKKQKGRVWQTGVVSPGPTSSYQLNVSKATLDYGDTTSTDLFVIPANANIALINTDVVTAFNDSGTDVVYIGKSGATTHFVSALSVTATGQTVTGYSNLGDVGSSDITVVGRYIGQNSDATAGSADVYIQWYQDK
jgi:hypothetical protein